MTIYYTLFALVFIFSVIAERNKKYDIKLGNKFIYIISLLAMLFSTSFVAGARDNSIGTDIYFYALKVFELSNNTPFFSEIDDLADPQIHILARSSRILSNTFGFFLFLIELWIVGFFCLAVHRMRDKLSITFVFMMFMLLSYNQTLNIMRQSMAMSVLLFAYSYLIENKWTKVFIYTTLAYFCHSTSLFFVIIILLYLIYNNCSLKTSIVTFLLILSVIMLSIYTLYSNLLNYAIDQSIIKEDYVRYLNGDSEKTLSKTNIVYNLLYISIYCPMLIKRNKGHFALLNVSLLVMIFFLSFIDFGGEIRSRIVLYFSYINMLLIPLCCHMMNKKIMLFVCFMTIFSFIFNICINNYGETCPYTSKFLGIL